MKVWVDYDDGHAGGYPHECDRCPTCKRTEDDYSIPALNCPNSWHLTGEDP
jgi:hypothetical protein